MGEWEEGRRGEGVKVKELKEVNVNGQRNECVKETMGARTK